ncbi:acetyl/propionyl/methylcrotonyl-CoA carboxylase subunit alpha [Rhizobacter sp. LjRoot28]|uniref:acetyl/propionyl/methylcrotonyl-CoA carboxylase subunit alpha n=1 Tax=Rhizobacter sp. LjRoot28 TaxID=3342309 RepID=UPI003ED0D73D
MKKVLVANRGEIAVRVIRACADHGVASVAVYADPDIDAVHVRMADEAHALEGTRPADTYLRIDKLIAIARRSGADAVHPGYGFLSESAAFARAVLEAGLLWIGPPPDAIAALGDKVSARRLASEVGAPLVAGTPGPVGSAEEVHAFADQHGFPIAIKAAFGGGGRGLKVARHKAEVSELFESAVREATAAFGRGECYVEQFIDKPRHIEAQVIADTHGAVVVLGTRDCSLQRRNQKLVEEAPAPFLTDAQRERIHTSARDICRHAGYVGAGTVEFLLSANGTISFLEVNTRLQVEHPVTEETTGVDLVVEQLRIADGLPLSVHETPRPIAHAFEFRINAEDVGRGFLPSPGPVHRFDPPSGPGVRVDAGVRTGSTVPGAFDSLMAKLIVTGATRDQAIRRARRALKEFRIEGLASVLPFHRAVMTHPDFVSEHEFKVHTRWIETEFVNDEVPFQAPAPTDDPLTRLPIEIDGRRVMLGLPSAWLGGLAAGAGSRVAHPADAAPAAAADSRDLVAPIAGTVLVWQVEDGATVDAKATVAVMEAMKMETAVDAHRGGRLVQRVPAGTYVAAGTVIAEITPDD